MTQLEILPSPGDFIQHIAKGVFSVSATLMWCSNGTSTSRKSIYSKASKSLVANCKIHVGVYVTQECLRIILIQYISGCDLYDILTIYIYSIIYIYLPHVSVYLCGPFHQQ